jgi:hypothetical protein
MPRPEYVKELRIRDTSEAPPHTAEPSRGRLRLRLRPLKGDRRCETHRHPVIPAGAFAFGYGGPRRRESRIGPPPRIKCGASFLRG